MKTKMRKIVSAVMAVVFMAAAFAGCSANTESPVEAKVKTDLNDASFVFTYGQLRTVLSGDKLATLFENTNKKTDDKTVELSYYEIVAKYGSDECFEDVLALISDEDMAKLTANQQQVLDYYNSLLNDIKENGSARVSYSESFWIDNDSGRIAFKSPDGELLDGQDELLAAFRLYSDTMLSDIGGYLMNRSQDEATNYGDDLTDIMYPFGEKAASYLTLADLYTDEETHTYPIYSSVIPTLVHALDENGDNAEDEEGEYIFIPSELNRTICITVKPEEESVKKAFTIRDQETVFEEFEKASAYMTLNSYEISFDPCTITAGINAETDEMTYVTFNKNMLVTASVTFTGALEKYGTVTVEFPCTSSLNYQFGWSDAAE